MQIVETSFSRHQDIDVRSVPKIKNQERNKNKKKKKRKISPEKGSGEGGREAAVKAQHRFCSRTRGKRKEPRDGQHSASELASQPLRGRELAAGGGAAQAVQTQSTGWGCAGGAGEEGGGLKARGTHSGS